MDFAPARTNGLAYVPSMALGVLLAGPLLTALLVACRQAPLQPYARTAGLWGTLAGAMWNAGNVRAPASLCGCQPPARPMECRD